MKSKLLINSYIIYTKELNEIQKIPQLLDYTMTTLII